MNTHERPDRDVDGRRSILGVLTRRWRAILLLALLASGPTSWLIYRYIEPTYEAASLLRVEPKVEQLYNLNDRQPSMEDVRPYLLTQRELIRSDSVLDAALGTSGIATLPIIAAFEGPQARPEGEALGRDHRREHLPDRGVAAIIGRERGDSDRQRGR